jgi:hypothetical protein
VEVSAAAEVQEVVVADEVVAEAADAADSDAYVVPLFSVAGQ